MCEERSTTPPPAPTDRRPLAGHFLAIDCTEGETVMIPPELIHHSIAENANVDLSLSYLTGSSSDPENVDSIMK